MSRVIIVFLVILLLAFSASAMKPLTENDLLNVNISQSLSINSDQIKEIHNKPAVIDNSEVLKEFYQTSSNSIILHFDMNLFQDPNETPESQSIYKPSFSFLSLCSKNDTFKNDRISLIDPITGKEYTSIISQDDVYRENQSLSINPADWKDYNTILSAEETTETETTISAPATITHSIQRLNNETSSSDSSYKYQIKSGNTLMRDTYIQDRKTFIQSGSWVDIKPR